MHPALRSALAQLAQRLLFVAIAVAAVIGFVVVAQGSGAQTGQHESVVPITINTDAPTSPTSPSTDPAPLVVGAGDSSAPPRAQPIRVTTIHRVVVSTLPVLSPVSPPGTAGSSPSLTRQRGSRPSAPTSASPAPTFRYVATRDIAALVNPSREAQGFADVTTVAAKTSAACIADSSCPGQVAVCGTGPTAIGSAGSIHVSDGQYRDQYGNCREVISY